MLKRIALSLAVLLLVLVAVVAANTFRSGSRQLDVPPVPMLAVDEAGAAAHLGEAVRLRTVSDYSQPALNADQFTQFHALLQTRYPKAHAVLKREIIGDLSLLYTWAGSDDKAKPILLLAHQDVVPVAAGTEKDWAVEPFSGTVKDGYVWGRGAWDDKVNVIAQMEAIEMLVASGYKPKRTVYLAFGADEEVGGHRGAVRIAALLKERKVRLDFVIDEGLLIAEGILPGVKAPVAMIGLAEKGFLSVVLRFPATPGHSSMPPPKGTGAIAMMSAALRRIDDDQLPAALRGVAKEMFETLAPETTGMLRVALSNLWLFSPIVQKQLEAAASTNALIRTTTALTIANAGNKDNVMPGRAEATINYRLLPGDTQEAVLARVKQQVTQTLGNDRFELFALPDGREASKVSPTEADAYKLINRTVREVFPGTLVVPGLVVAGTDSTHFTEVSDHIYRFSPVRAKAEDLPRFHGTNERISSANLAELVRFYHRLVTVGAQAP